MMTCEGCFRLVCHCDCWFCESCGGPIPVEELEIPTDNEGLILCLECREDDAK